MMAMTEDRRRLGVGMIGYAFMGAAHSQAWRDGRPVLRPAAAARAWPSLVRPRRGRGARRRPSGSAGQSRRDRLAARCVDARRHRPGRHLHPRRHPRRDRDRRAGGRQARAVREAAGQHRRRGRGDGRRGRAGRGRTACARWSASPTAGCPAIALARAAGRRGPDRRDPARARAVPAGLARRPGVPAGLAAADRSEAGSGALGDIGAHIVDLAQFVTGELHHRRVRR